MEKIGYGKWDIWMAITVLLSLLADSVIAQPGFLSVDCGGKENHTVENNIKWVTDDNYIDVGETAYVRSATSPSYLQRLRFFPKPLNKSCYQLPVEPDVPYLIRLWFSLGNYSRFSGGHPRFTHTIETLGMLISTPVANKVPDPYIHEGIYVSSGGMLYICLIRNYETDDPFINAIELRKFENGMYSQAKSGTMLFLQLRQDVGGNSIVRYPLDKFDRIWKSYMYLYNSNSARNVSLQEPIFNNNTKNLPPTAVMQTAWVMNVDNFFVIVPTAPGAKSLLLLYLAELEKLTTSQSRSFYVTRNGKYPSETITLVRNHSALELTLISNETEEYEFTFHLVKANGSTNPPIINAFEYYTIHHTERATSSQDSEALDAIKIKYDIKDWISDPCYSIPWNGLGCVNGSLAIRIAEINLSGRNLRGSVPDEIGQLTALVNLSIDNNQLIGRLPNLSNLIMLERLHLQNNNLTGNVPDWLFKLKNLKELSLDNNHLIGPLPNFSSLTMLELLHLQNNSFNGSVPYWLFELKNLKELFIQNNNFSGVIPAQLLDKPSLNAKFSGNNYLCVQYEEGKCIEESRETRNNSKNVILAISIGGCLVLVLALMMGITVYRRKLREKKRFKEGSDKILSKLPNSRAFTIKEMRNATKNFSEKIGQGGSGSVYSGKLRREEKDIAVKEFSSSKRFDNEVDVFSVLSKDQNKNLVYLLGFCNESKRPLLIYEHMSKGSLWNMLHGSNPGELNWERRVQIALDVASALEILHVRCNPRIIHRDVKTANILLDDNMNAKLADFGISKIANYGEATHASTSTAEGTPGYIAPENESSHEVSDKSDIYSFGVVLFEIICGTAVTNANAKEEPKLVERVKLSVKGEEIDAEIIDKRLAKNYDMKSIARVAKLALRCVDDSPACRPSIGEVVEEIKKAQFQCSV